MNMSADRKIPERLVRSAALYGDSNIEKLMTSKVIVFGLGGVGGQAALSLCRAGVGKLVLIDSDDFAESNINRQAGAFYSSIGRKKTEHMKALMQDINPEIQVELHDVFYGAESADTVVFSDADCVIDAIDTVSAKILIIEKAKAHNIPVISCMGAGNKLDPSGFRAADIYESSGCPLARVMRSELRKRGIKNVRVVFSPEPPISPKQDIELRHSGRPSPASSSFCPPAAGLIAAAEAVRLILEVKERNN